MGAKDTACEDCLFAQWYTGGVVQSQVGCGLGRLARYAELGLAEEAQEECEAGTVRSYVIKGGCRHKRVPPWGDELSRQEQVERVKGEARLKMAAVILLGPEHWTIVARDAVMFVGDSYDEVVVVNNGFHLRGAAFTTFVEGVARDTEHPSVCAVQMVDEATDLEALDEGVSRVKEAAFYTVVVPPQHLTDDDAAYHAEVGRTAAIPARVNELVNEGMMRFVCLLPTSSTLNGLTVHTVTHRKAVVGGNKPMEFADSPDELDSPTGKKRIVANVGEKLSILAQAFGEPWLCEPLSILERGAATCE